MDAVAYLMTPPAAFEAPPSEAYLCAIRRMLRESGAGDEPIIPLLRTASDAERATGAAVVPLAAPWVRPARLETLRAVLYEAGAAVRPPWQLPRRAAEAEAALRAAGVDDVAALRAWLRRDVASHASPLRSALAAAGHAEALDADAEAALAAALLADDVDAAPAESA